MTNNHKSGRVIRTIIVILCIINIVFLVIASRRGVNAGNISSIIRNPVGSPSAGVSADSAMQTDTASTETAAAVEKKTGARTAGSHNGVPSITLSDKLPDLTQDDLDDVVPVLKRADAISADDGNGNDITDDIDAVATADLDNLGDFTIQFSVTNDNDETAETSCDVTVDITKPILELSDYRITLERYANFRELSYVDTAVDENGSDLSRNILITGDVDTSSAGTYEVTYAIRSAIDGARAEKTLRVTVE